MRQTNENVIFRQTTVKETKIRQNLHLREFMHDMFDVNKLTKTE